MKQKLLIFFLFGLFALNNAFAQNRKITGTVIGSDDNLPLPGVSVQVTGTKTGSQTNELGSFSVNVPANARSLTFTYIGYGQRTVQLGNQSVISVKLSSDNKALNEVVITGYGTERKSEIAGSIVSIKATQIEDKPIQTFDRALQGRAAGVSVTSNSGQPGSSISVKIRGTSTLYGTSDPLYIIDGVQVNSGEITGTTASGSTSLNALSSINPDDIESIQVLKDAASSAIYGSQGGNGVVIVTTKRGKAGKTQVSASAQYGYTQTYNPYKVLNATQYFDLQKEAYTNYNLRIGNTAAQGITSATAASFPGGLPTTIQNYDWVKAINRTGHVGQYDISLSGGDAKTKFFISGSYNNTDGTIITSNFTRGTVRGNIDHKISDKFSITTSLSLTGSSEVGPSTGAGFYTNTPFTGSLLTSPVNSIYNSDGSYNTSLVGVNTSNEVQYLNQEKRSVGTFQTVDNMAITYNILPELSFKAFGGLDFLDAREFNYRPSTLSSAASVLGQGTETYRRNINYTTNGTFNFNKTFAIDHHLSAIVGFEYRDVSYRSLSASAQGFPSPLLTLLSSASTPTVASSAFTGYKNAGFLGQVNYNYKGKYIFTANARDDGSSRFGENHKYGLFYGLLGAWNVTSEEFMKDISFISQLKPRVSYGVTGTQLPGTYNFYPLGLYSNGGSYGGSTLLGGLRPTQLANPDLTWERKAAIDLGLDLGLFNNRISASFDVYRNKSTNLLVPVTLPGDAGYTSYFENAGTAKSEGIEIDLNTVNFTKGFRWTTNFNIAFQRNKILSLVNGLTNLSTYYYTVGMPIGTLYTYQWAGVNPADGRPMYYDKNNNITYSPTTSDRRIVGDINPKVLGGFDNTFSYKGVSLDVLFQYSYGSKSYLQTAQYIETSGSVASNQNVNQLERWTTPGEITWVPRAYSGLTEPGGYSLQNLSSRFIEDASYIRLKQVSLTYTLPKSLLQHLKIPSLSVYCQGYNLATITHYRGDDPENSGNNLNFYPNPRTLTFGIKGRF